MTAVFKLQHTVLLAVHVHVCECVCVRARARLKFNNSQGSNLVLKISFIMSWTFLAPQGELTVYQLYKVAHKLSKT